MIGGAEIIGLFLLRQDSSYGIVCPDLGSAKSNRISWTCFLVTKPVMPLGLEAIGQDKGNVTRVASLPV
jgi:hypothetical protein